MADPYVLFATVPDYERLSKAALERVEWSLLRVADQLPGRPVVVVGGTGMTLAFVPIPGGTAPILVDATTLGDDQAVAVEVPAVPHG